MTGSIKSLVRKMLSFLSYHFYYRFLYRRYERDIDGRPLKKGITAVVVARDEETIIPLALRSLVGFADQVVCIDNGSSDATLRIMEDFKKEFEGRIEVDVLSMPGALLGDCRQKGLDLTRYSWHLRWDADMVFKTSGPEDCRILRERVLSNDRPRAVQLPRTNLFGDFHHTSKLYSPVDPGEPILIKYCRKISYREFGKFDTVRLPYYYVSVSEKKRYYFHCDGLKSDMRLIYRNAYFDWRQSVNARNSPDSGLNFNEFRDIWLQNRYGTLDDKRLKYRYQKELMRHITPFETEKYGEYPEIILEAIKSGNERFKIIYRDGKAVARRDAKDPGQMLYQPDEVDLSFDPMTVFRAVIGDPVLLKKLEEE